MLFAEIFTKQFYVNCEGNGIFSITIRVCIILASELCRVPPGIEMAGFRGIILPLYIHSQSYVTRIQGRIEGVSVVPVEPCLAIFGVQEGPYNLRCQAGTEDLYAG